MVSKGTDVAGNRQRYMARQGGPWFGGRCCYVFCSVSALVLVAGRYVGSVVDSIDGTQTIDETFPADADWGPADIAGVEAGELNVLETQPAPAADTHETGSMNMLLTDEGGRGPYEQVAGHTTRRRNDSLMLIYLRAHRSQIYAMSVMRDPCTDSAGQGKHKISSGLNSGGIPLVVQSIEAIFSRRFDHIDIIGTDDFAYLADPLGGVERHVPATFDSYHQLERDFRAGMQVLDDGAAVTFVCEREVFQDRGYQHVDDQQMDLHSVLATLPSKHALPDPLRARHPIREFVLYMAVDKNFSASIVVELAQQRRSKRSNDVHTDSELSDVTRTSGVDLSIVLECQSTIAGISHAHVNRGSRWIPPQYRVGSQRTSFFYCCQFVLFARIHPNHAEKVSQWLPHNMISHSSAPVFRQPIH